MKRTPSWPLALLLAAAAAAQNESTLPAACADLPGNAALSMPLRWTHGILQVRIEAGMLPAGLPGRTISGLRLRKPAFLDEPAYPALQRTLTVRGGFDTRPASQLGQNALSNRPPNVAVLFGPAPVAVAATAATGPGTDLGEELVTVQLTTPLLVTAGNLFLEFEAGDAPLAVLPGHWVDGVWFVGGVERGYVVTVGDGSCTTRGEQTRLAWHDPTTGPRVGGSAVVRMTGAPPRAAGTPGTLAYLWFGIDPQPRAIAPGFVGYGGSLAALDPGLAGCHQWAPLDAVVSGNVDFGGTYSQTFQLAAGATAIGMRIGVQGAWLDPARPGLPIAVSNGLVLVLDRIGVGDDCATQFFADGALVSPWPPFLGQMPVIVLEHD